MAFVIDCWKERIETVNFLQYLINGVSIGAVYAIIALGYTMVYGIAKMLNFAHGDVIMVGAYMSFSVTTYLGLPTVAGIAVAVLVCTLLGVLIEGLAYKPLRGVPSLAVLITAIGVSYFLQNAAQLIWGSAPKNFKSIVLFDGQLTITGEVIYTIAASVLIMLALTLFINKSRMARPCAPCRKTGPLPSSWASTSTRPFPPPLPSALPWLPSQVSCCAPPFPP